MSTMSEAIVLLWLVPVILNIIVPLAALGCWLGARFVRICQQKLVVERAAEEKDEQLNQLLSAAKN